MIKCHIKTRLRYPSLSKGCIFAAAPCLGPSGLTLRDWSGYGNHGTLTNGPYFETSQKYAIYFDGSNDKVDYGTLAPLAANTLTTSLWCKPVSTTASQKSMASQIDATGNIGRALRQNNTQVEWTLASSGSVYRVWRSATNVITTTWQHVLVIAEGAAAPRMWINGVESSVTLAASSGTPSVPAAQPFCIGFDGGFSQTLYNFNGHIDDVLIYHRVLSSQEIRLLASRRGIAYESIPDYSYDSYVTSNSAANMLLGTYL